MTFRQLKQLVDELTEEQLDQKVYFVEPYDNAALHEVDLVTAPEPILARQFDAELKDDDRGIPADMPYLA